MAKAKKRRVTIEQAGLGHSSQPDARVAHDIKLVELVGVPSLRRLFGSSSLSHRVGYGPPW
jgi:hypothetical protein